VAADTWLAPLLDAAGMREADRWAISEQEIPSLRLMETAGQAVADATAELAAGGPIRVVCGKGNNGGDGIVAARLLMDRGFEVEVVLLWPVDELSPDSKANLERYTGGVRRPGPEVLADALARSEAIVDAVFGTGFEGAPREPALSAIEAINDCPAPVVACDVPSGVDASTGVAEGVAVEAERTVTFHGAKVGHFIAPGKRRTGTLSVADIGIPGDAPSTPAAGTIEEQVLDGLPRRRPGGNKFDSGDVLVVGGSRGLTGAVCMAAEAAIRAGAGYAAVAAPGELEPILEVKLTEVMTLAVPGREGSLDPEAAAPILERGATANCVVLGPGLGRSEGAAALARDLARRIAVPLLIDADGLNALGTDLGALEGTDRPLVLTPHAGELGRLLGSDSGAVDERRLDSATAAARRCGGIVVLKGDDTIVTDGERVAVNAEASPGLATAGTGDVLSGTIAALLARGAEPFEAACAGVLAHARAGRVAAERVGTESVIATDVIGALPAGLAR
jgi:hydroxyethylthiazole kinase-like uncharacterized protein yjeF